MSDYSIKKIYDSLEDINKKTDDNNRRLVRIENAVLGDEHGDFKGHKQRLEVIENEIPAIRKEQRKTNDNVKKIYWTAGSIALIVSLLAATITVAL